MYKFNLIVSSLILVLILGFTSCKENSKSTENIDGTENTYDGGEGLPISTLVANATENPEMKNIVKIFEGLNNKIRSEKDNPEKRKSLLLDGIKYAKQFEKRNFEANYYTPLMKDFPDENTKDYIFEMATIMKSFNNTSAADVLYSNFANLYPSDKRTNDAKSNISDSFGDMESYLKSQADLAFKREAGTKIDKKVVQSYVNACEAYALSNPNGKLTPSYLYKGSELARSIKSLEKVLSLYDWIIEKYPNYEKTPTVLFLKGFILENEIKSIDMAKKVYEEFLVKYPKHELVDDVKFLIKNIGKSNEEILKLLGKDKK